MKLRFNDFFGEVMMSDILDCAGREFSRRKGRTLSNIFGYFLAVGLMVVLVNVLLFSKSVTGTILSKTGIYFVTFMPSCREGLSLTPAQLDGISKGVVPIECKEKCKECTGCLKKPIDFRNEAFIANTVITRLLPLDLVDKIMKLSTVEDASPYLQFRFKDPTDEHLFSVGGYDTKNESAVGATCCAPSDVLSGAFTQPGDRGVVMLEESYARSRRLIVGNTVTVAGVIFPVIGIINTGVRPAKADIYMPIEDAENVINRRIRAPLFHEINAILVKTKSSLVQEQAMESVKQIVQGGVISTYACYQPAAKVLGMNENAVWILAVLIGIGAVLFSSRSQLASIIERRNDIGILKAIGWANSNIVFQVLTESLIQACVGAILGGIFGNLLVFLVPVKTFTGIDAELSPSFLVTFSAWILSLLGGIIAGISPAFRAARQKPADTLRRV
ncbi:FtsX-like permease family protein [bacterium]|nr:FtsX-like permease family protein [bacterium]